MIFELRQYSCFAGERDNWVRFMEEEIIPFQQSKGMVILGSFVAEGDDSTYIWIRRFADDDERKAQYDAVYQSAEWKERIGPRIPAMMDREKIQVTRLVPTAKSPIQ